MLYVTADGVEYKNLQKALECSKDTLAYVNKEVRECENRQRLEDIQSRLDTSSMPKDFAVSLLPLACLIIGHYHVQIEVSQ